MADPVTWIYIASAVMAGVAYYAATQISVGDREDIGSQVNKSGTSASRDPVYGTCRTSAVPVYSNVQNNNSSQLLSVFSCGIGVTAVKQLYIDDVEVLSAQGSFRETADGGNDQLRFDSTHLKNGFEKQCEIQFRAGLDTGVPMQLAIDYGDGEWTPDMRGDRVCAVAVRSTRIVDDQGVRIMSENYQVNLLVDGLPLYDPRYHSDPSEKTFFNASAPVGYQETGRNPALAILDYLTDTYYGLGLPLDQIDINSFKQAATWCDDNKFKIDGQLDSASDFSSNLDAMLKTANLSLFTEAGFITLRFQDLGVPVYDFHEDNILNNSLRITESSSSSYANVVEVEFKNTELDDAKDVFTCPENTQTDPQVLEDGFISSTTLKMPMTRYAGSNRNDQASPMKKLANRELRRNQFQRQISFDVDMYETPVRVFDIVTITDENLGWVEKPFRVMAAKKSVTTDRINVATIEASEYDDSVYLGTVNGGGGSLKLAKPTVSTPTGLQFVIQDYVTDGYGTLSWSRTWFESNCEYIVDYRRSSDPSWIRLGRTKDEQWKVARLQPDLYDFRVAIHSNLYGTSDFVELNDVEISPLGVMPEVTGTTADFTGQDFEVEWNDMLQEPVSGYPVSPDSGQRKIADIFRHYRVSLFDVSGTQTLIKTFTTASNTFTYTYEQNVANGITRSLKATIEIVSVDGSVSGIGTGSQVTKTNSQHPAATGFTISGELSVFALNWYASSESDFAGTLVQRSYDSSFSNPTTFDTKGSSITDVVPLNDSNDTLYYYRVGSYDKFGTDNINWTAYKTIRKTSFDSLLPEFPNELGDLRDPSKAQNQDGELTWSTASPNGKQVAGLGLYAKDTGETRAVIAADELVVSTGGHAEWNSTVAYSIGDRVAVTISDTQERLYEALRANTNKAPASNPSDWVLKLDNSYQSAFYVDAANESLFIRNATIKDLTGDKILAGEINANHIVANAINGTHISASSDITAGSGNDIVRLNGTDSTWRIAAGNSNMGSAPFRVNKYGKLYAVGADIEGDITARTLTLTGSIPSTIDNSNVTTTSIGAETPAGAQAKADSAESGAISTASADATTKANAAQTNAINTAAADATTKANAAESSAVSTAATDATNKANAAESGAKTWTENRIYPNQDSLQLKSGNYSAGLSGWAIDADGNCEFNNGTFRGTLTGANGTFEGTVYANRIVGDVVSATVLDRDSDTQRTDNIWITIQAWQITPDSYSDRHFIIPNLEYEVYSQLLSSVPDYIGVEGTCQLRVLVDGVQKDISKLLSVKSTKAGTQESDDRSYTAVVTIPASSSTSTVTLQMQASGSTDDETRAWGQLKSITTFCQLFRKGGAITPI